MDCNAFLSNTPWLFEITPPLNYVCKGDILSDGRYLNRDSFPQLGIGDNDSESPFNTGDTVTLIANIIDFHITCLTFLNGWSLWRVFAFRLGRLWVTLTSCW